MKAYTYLTLIALLTLIMFSCKTDTKKNKIITKTEVVFKKEAELTIYSLQDIIPTKVTTLDIEIADDEYQIQTGLMYRKAMLPNQGMLFTFPEEAPRSFYMKNTEFSLDIIFIDEENKIVSIQKNAKPYDEASLPSEGPAKYVLEVNANRSNEWNLKKGDSIHYKLIK